MKGQSEECVGAFIDTKYLCKYPTIVSRAACFGLGVCCFWGVFLFVWFVEVWLFWFFFLFLRKKIVF